MLARYWLHLVAQFVGLGSRVGKEKLAGRSHQRYASSLSSCTQNSPPCPGEKLPRFVTFVTGEDPPITVSNTLQPLVLRPPSRPGDTSPGA